MKKVKSVKKKATKKKTTFIGKCYFFRTITYHVLGRVKGIVDMAGTKFFELETGTSWVADSGRFGTAINSGELSEVEFIEKAVHFVNPASCVDILEWVHPLPTHTK